MSPEAPLRTCAEPPHWPSPSRCRTCAHGVPESASCHPHRWIAMRERGQCHGCSCKTPFVEASAGVVSGPSCPCHKMTNSQGKGSQYNSCTRGLCPTITGPKDPVGYPLGPSPLRYFSLVVGRFRCHVSGDADDLDWFVALTCALSCSRECHFHATLLPLLRSTSRASAPQ